MIKTHRISFSKYLGKSQGSDSPSDNRGVKTFTTHFLLPSDTSNAKNGLHLIELLPKDAPWKPPHNIGYWLLSTD